MGREIYRFPNEEKMTTTFMIGDVPEVSSFNSSLADELNQEEAAEARRRRVEKLKRGKAGTPDETETELILPATNFTGSYTLIRANTYALGLHALRKACIAENNQEHPNYTVRGSIIYIPLTFKENIEARVNDYESHKPADERLRLFNTWLDSRCAIAYQIGTGKFKLDLQSSDLTALPPDFNQLFKTIDYSQINGQEFDRSEGKYNTRLTKDEVLNHPAWLALVEGDQRLLKKYCDIVFAERKGRKLMAFWLFDTPTENQLRAVCVINLGNSSNADGSNNLNDDARFLCRSP